MEQREEALEESPSDVEGALVVGRQKGLALLSSEQVLSRLAALVFIDLQGWNMTFVSSLQRGRVAGKISPTLLLLFNSHSISRTRYRNRTLT